MGKEVMHMRRLKPDDLEQFNSLLRYAFQVTRGDLLQVGWEDEEILQSKSPILESADVIGWFDGDKLTSQIAVYPMKMNVQGNIYNMGYITGVATYPEYTGQGLVKELMKQSLAQMRNNGQAISLLYPYSIPFYRHRGWEIISDKMGFKIKDTQLPKGLAAPGKVRRSTPEAPEVIEIHNRFAQANHGCIVRNALVWEEYWRWDVDDTLVAVYYDERENPLGYMVYLLQEDQMQVKEIVCLKFEAWKGLWAFIAAHDSMIDEVVGNNFYNHPLAYWLQDSATKETIRPYMMGRIVDVPQFLQNYSFRPQKEDVAITFDVKDPLLEWNNKHFHVCFKANGQVALQPQASSHIVALPVGTLTTLLMGYQRPWWLQQMEQLDAGRGAVELLEHLIYNRKPYISENM